MATLGFATKVLVFDSLNGMFDRLTTITVVVSIGIDFRF